MLLQVCLAHLAEPLLHAEFDCGRIHPDFTDEKNIGVQSEALCLSDAQVQLHEAVSWKQCAVEGLVFSQSREKLCTSTDSPLWHCRSLSRSVCMQ